MWQRQIIGSVFTCELRTLALGLVSLFLASCATTSVDWDSRVGNFTLDQTITDLGPPDKSAKLTDGSTVAEWLLSKGQSGGVMVRSGPSWHGRYGYAGGHYTHVATYGATELWLRLTFNAEGKLAAWKKLYR